MKRRMTRRSFVTAAGIGALAGRTLRGQQAWHDAIVRAVYDHPDGIAIMKVAADLAEQGYGRRARRG